GRTDARAGCLLARRERVCLGGRPVARPDPFLGPGDRQGTANHPRLWRRSACSGFYTRRPKPDCRDERYDRTRLGLDRQPMTTRRRRPPMIPRWMPLGLLACAIPALAGEPNDLLPPVPIKAGARPLDVEREGHAAPFVGDLDGDGKL